MRQWVEEKWCEWLVAVVMVVVVLLPVAVFGGKYFTHAGEHVCTAQNVIPPYPQSLLSLHVISRIFSQGGGGIFFLILSPVHT